MIAAIIPAAGQSRRMGRPKVLLEHEGRSILASVIAALREGGADLVVAIVPHEIEPEGPTVADAAFKAGAAVIAPVIRPAEMRDSIEIGLNALEARQGGPPSAVLIVPADIPGITPSLVRKVLEQGSRLSEFEIVIPRFQGKRGHPIFLRWDTARRIHQLPPDVGINVLVAAEREAGRVHEVEIAETSVPVDIDTPEDWSRWQAELAPAHTRRVKVRLFALAKQKAGASQITVEVGDLADVRELKAAITRQFPALADLLPNVLISVDSDYATDDTPIPENAQVAIIPPVSGGATSPAPRGTES